MRVDGRDRAAAIAQLNNWARENPNVWTGGRVFDVGRSRVDWHELLKQWKPVTDVVVPAQVSAPAGAAHLNVAVAIAEPRLAPGCGRQRARKITMWSWQQAYAWYYWRSLDMVARVVPSAQDENIDTVESLLASQNLALRGPLYKFPRGPKSQSKPSDPAADFPPVIGTSLEDFQSAINSGSCAKPCSIASTRPR